MKMDQLRKSILQMAVQGKLVAQDENDGPASILLEKIRKEKARLCQQGKIKKPKSESLIFRRNGSWWEKTGSEEKCIDDEIPFEIPESWEWVRLGSAFSLLSGQDLTPNLYNEKSKGIPYITGASNINEEKIFINRWTEAPRNIAKKGDLLIVCKGSVGKFAFLEVEQAHIARQLMAVRNLYGLNFEYIRYVIQFYIGNIVKNAQGIIPGIAREVLLETLLPLPPLAEQKRIADRLNEILAHIAAYKQTAGELRQLSSNCKKSILQYAIQGRLVPQDENDEPASVLLEKIRKEKARLFQQGKIKKPKSESRIFRRAGSWWEKTGKEEKCIDAEIPFEIPSSWEWVRLGNLVAKDIKRGKSPRYVETSEIRVFAQKCNVKNSGIDLSLAKFLDPGAFHTYPESEYLQDGDIVINSTGEGTLGRVGIFVDKDRIDDKTIVPDSHVTIIRFSGLQSAFFYYYALLFNQPALEKMGSGSTKQTELSASKLHDLLLPLPPLAEQKRIADRLAQFMEIDGRLGEALAG